MIADEFRISRNWGLTVKCALIAALVVFAFATAAKAQVYTPEIGGREGAPFEADCKNGHYLVGVNFTAGKALNTIQPLCRATKGGIWIGDDEQLKVRGGAEAQGFSTFAAAGPVRCQPNQYVTALHVWWDHFGDVHHVQIFCHNASRSSEFTDQTNNAGGEPNQDDSSPCPKGLFANALTGATSNLVNRLGLRCAPLIDAQ
jgi:hypothetical protein